jgi:glycosyltransferase involved in cell wall biosynthesis
MSAKPLVSVLIPAYNAQEWIAETIRSALAQTWPNKEIIVVDDGSRDGTARVARQFESEGVRVVTKPNEGAAATRNRAFEQSKGDFIQWLDADDLLSPDKIERQLAAPRALDDKHLLLSCPWAPFSYRPEVARFEPNSLWSDLSPVEWLIRKMGENLHMQTATWLTSRALAQAAGPWDTRMLSDDDGEYFCRVLLRSSGVRFVREARVYYRSVATSRLSFVGNSDRKMDAMLLSMKLHIQNLQSLEDSPRTRNASLRYINNWAQIFSPTRVDIMVELGAMARSLGGELQTPKLRWKYAWLEPIIGRQLAWQAQVALPHIKARVASAAERFFTNAH